MATWRTYGSQPMYMQTPMQYLEPAEDESIVGSITYRLHKGGRFSTLASDDHMKDHTSAFNPQQLQAMMQEAHQKRIMFANRMTEQCRRQTASAATAIDRKAQQYLHHLDSFESTNRGAMAIDDEDDTSYDATILKIEDDSEDEKVSTPVTTRSFRIDEKDKVEEFLISRLGKMQQTAVKRLAKAWIKAICPKKQAKFPYHDATEIPKWWPDPDECPFREPDHIKKEKRLNLCLHLLRLRPKPGQLQEWNGDPEMPHSSHNLSEWTKFLQHTASIDVLKDLRESEQSIESRVKYLKELYTVAQMEEDYLNDAIDGTDTFTWIEDPAEKAAELKRKAKEQLIETTPRPTKRQRQDESSKSSKITTPQDIRKIETEEHHRPAKKRKHTRRKQNTHTESTSPPCEPVTTVSAAPLRMDTSAMQPYQDSVASEASRTYQDIWNRSRAGGSQHRVQDEMLTTSFSSSGTSYCAPSATDSFIADSQGLVPISMGMQHGIHNLNFSQDQHHMIIPTHMVSQIPQPTFDTVPNTPALPHSSLYGLPMDHSLAIAASTQPHVWSSSQPTYFPSSQYDNQMCIMPSSAALMMRSGSDNNPYIDMRHRGSCASLTNSPITRTDSRATHHQAGRATHCYEPFSRPI
ncbi:hypothetical protein AMS68_005103 [Peltaster fructicola]|uniref:Subtelomeric hrmA-associated cluster protein AFUB-079030/YDR124W-like helical bundle domain-containing protein n=1 Tax=Peltaster fructicola TaxID=286661 RepID=A0A6H0XY32_9PEZI|nr:hypothetical protein AMS68_005103 [Peltaster fructicola]